MNHSMEIQASLHSDIDLTIHKADGSVQRQITDIQNMMDDGTDVIIISPINPDSLVPIVTKAYKKGIPIILLDRKINSENYTSYIGADNTEIGKEAANYILSDSYLPKKIIEIRGDDKSSPTVERSRGFHEAVEKQTNAKIIRSFSGLPEEAFKKTLDSLQNQKIYVFTFNDNLAGKAWQIARNIGTEKNIQLVGVDGLNTPDGGIPMVLDGKLNATILYPFGANEAIETAIKLHEGKQVPRRILLNTTIIDRFNAVTMQNQFNKITEQQSIIEQQVATVKKTEKEYSIEWIYIEDKNQENDPTDTEAETP